MLGPIDRGMEIFFFFFEDCMEYFSMVIDNYSRFEDIYLKIRRFT